MDRQRRVLGHRADLTVVLGAGALSLVVGSPEIMADQVEHLRGLEREGTAKVRVRPWSAGAYPGRGSFALLDFPDAEDPAVGYVEFIGGARYVEQPAQVDECEHVFGVLLDRTLSIEEWHEQQ
jgi:Domain of unknown function (DUF5753)